MNHRALNAVEAVAQRVRHPYQCIAVRPLSPVIGAEVEGLDLRLPLAAEEAAELRRAFFEHHVLVFRDQMLSASDHRRVGTALNLTVEPGRRRETRPKLGMQAPTGPVVLGETWRADETYRPVPPAAGSLHVQRLPDVGAGGDMVFANMHLAYDLLSISLLELLQGLTAVHMNDPGGPAIAANGAAEHPVAMRHPVTGRPALYVNRRHTSHIVQLDAGHSQATLDMLFRHLEANPVLTCRVRWTSNALVVWDNHCTQHLTLRDFRPGSVSGHFIPFIQPPPAGPQGLPPDGHAVH